MSDTGAAQATNDTAVAVENDTTKAAENTEQTDGENTEGEDGGEKQAEEEDELDVDGQKYKVPRKVAEHLNKNFQADYTRKTQALAEQGKTLETKLASFDKVSDEVIEARAEIHAVSKSLKQYEDYFKTPAWDALKAQDPVVAQQHYLQYSEMKGQRDTAARTLEEKQGQLRDHANRENGERIARAQAEIAKHVEGWAPGNELDLKISAYGTSLGFTPQELGELAIRAPKLVGELNRLRLFDEAAKKQKTQQTFEKTQAAQPVTRVGGNGGTAQQRKTTDASGDALSTEEWAKRERDRLSKRTAQAGR